MVTVGSRSAWGTGPAQHQRPAWGQRRPPWRPVARCRRGTGHGGRAEGAEVTTAHQPPPQPPPPYGIPHEELQPERLQTLLQVQAGLPVPLPAALQALHGERAPGGATAGAAGGGAPGTRRGVASGWGGLPF